MQLEAPERKAPEKQVTKQMARSVATTTASQFGVICANFVTSIAQARLLGAAGRGDVTRFSNAAALAALYFGLGINSGIIYFLARGSVEPRPLVRVLFRLFGVTVGLMALCTIAVAASGLRRLLPHDLSTTHVVLLLILHFALAQAGAWLSAMLTARARFIPINITTVTVSMTGALTSVLLLLLWPQAGPATIMVLLVGLELFRVLLLAGFALPVVRESPEAAGTAPSAPGAPPFEARALLAYSIATLTGEALQFFTYRLDMWVIDAYRGAADLGRYSLAVSLAQLVWIVPSASARVLFPYSAMISGSDGARLAWRTARISLLIAAATAALGHVASSLLLTTFFGDDFAQVPSLLGILLVGVVPFSVAKVLSGYLAGIGAIRASVAISFLTLLVTALLDFQWIPASGAVGAAWATAVSYTFGAALTVGWFIRKSGLSVRELLLR